MPTTNYTVTMSWGESWTMQMDAGQASAPILCDGEPTPFQTADAAHDPEEAARMVADWLDAQSGGYLGEDGSVAEVNPEDDEEVA